MVVQDVGFGALIEAGIIGGKFVGRATNELGKKLFDLDLEEETAIDFKIL